MVEVEVDGKIIRGVLEHVNGTVLVTTRDSQRSVPTNGRPPVTVARDLLLDCYASDDAQKLPAMSDSGPDAR
jgi:hypothetical protein